VVLEALMMGGLIYSNGSQPVTVKPNPRIIAIHMIQPAPPKPKPTPPPPKPLLAKTPAPQAPVYTLPVTPPAPPAPR